MSVEGGIGCEEDSSFHQLMLLRANDDETILNIMKQKMRKHTDHHTQNEILQVMALQHLRTIADEISKLGYFVLEFDEVRN